MAIGGDGYGTTYRQEAQALAYEQFRPAGAPGVSDARQAARGEREGARHADGAPREAEQVGGGEDQGESQSDLGETSVWYKGADAPSWTWTGSQPQPVVSQPHVYLSTSCYHGDHVYCRAGVRGDGKAKRPATCKFCDSRCICSCHR